MKLILVRHGATLSNEQKRFIGQTNIALSLYGKRQVATLGSCLASEPIDVIVTSDLERASATAEAIAVYHRVPVYRDIDLREISKGDWEGYTYDEVLERDPNQMALWHSAPTNCRVPGGETLNKFYDRVIRAIERWYTRYPEGIVMWVTHLGVIRVLLCYLLKVDLNHWRQFDYDNASIVNVKVSCTDGVLTGLIEATEITATDQKQ